MDHIESSDEFPNSNAFIYCYQSSICHLQLNIVVPRIEEEHVIGFEDSAKQVKELLLGGHENLQVITIAGMSGLGKTTLAKMVYKNPDVDHEYMIRAFVYISRQYDKKDVLLEILSSFSKTNEAVKKMQEEDLEKHVCEELKGNQYLIVLDDVWEPEHWDAFKGAFPSNDKRCRVLITSTNARLAEYANPTNPNSLYLLDFLRPEHCRELLLWKVFGHDNIPDMIEEHVKEIAIKCDGLPLAIVLIAGVLLDRRDRVTWWKEVSSSVYKYLSMDESEGNKVVEMMYEHLPNQLKPCFLYLGVFREDSEIPVWKLVRLWISEGFIDGGGKSNLEDTAEEYLEKLVQRNLVMVGRRRTNGKTKSCRLHDTLREFCKKKGNEENLFQEINMHSLNFNSENCRRLCINGPITEEFMSGPVSGKRVRSFLTFQKEEESSVEQKHVSIIPKTFKLLKVLEAHSLCLPRFPPDLCRLVLLKYLTITSNISAIPSPLSGLWNLQTLVVHTDSQTLKLEMDLWKLPHFRHFHTNSVASLPTPDTKSQKGEEQLLVENNVRTLCTISSECCSRKVLHRTPRLKKLGICGDLDKLFDSNDESKFGTLSELENLKLTNAQVHSNHYSLPSHTCFPPRLTKLTLEKTSLEWKKMSTLGRLENLEVLKLKDLAFEGETWDTEEGGFVHLAHLYIGATDLVSWRGASEKTFPRLKGLELNGCYGLEALPPGLVDVPTLQSLVLYQTNPGAVSSARKLQRLKLQQAHGSKLSLSVYYPAPSESSP